MESYPSAENQSVYSTAPTERVKTLFEQKTFFQVVFLAQEVYFLSQKDYFAENDGKYVFG